MKRRRFTAGLAAGAGALLAGCSSGSDSTSTTDETTSDGGTSTDGATSSSGTASTTTASTTTTSTANVTSVAYQQYVDLPNGLRTAVTKARVADSYEADGTTHASSDDTTFLLVRFTTRNPGQSPRSLPDGATPSVLSSASEYDPTSSSQSAWEQYRSSSVEGGASAERTVAFEVPNTATASLDTSVELSYSASGERRAVRWSME